MEAAGRLRDEATPVPFAVAGLPELAEALSSVGYSRSGVRAILGVETDLRTAPADLVGYARRLASAPGALADVIGLLALGWPRPVGAMAAALGTAALDVLIASRAVVELDGALHPALRIVPHGELLLASDRRAEPGARPGPLHVTGINPPATLLAALTVRRAGSAALDLGTGNGVQALLAARHCDRVVATDVNDRALAFAAFNAALNGMPNIEFRNGSLFDPVAGERFDLVVSNPPYVISPDHDFAYRDSGAAPGALCAELVRGLPEHLAVGGFASMLASWPVGEPPWWSVPGGWLGENCRAWLVQLRTEDPLLHAQQWHQPLVDAGDLAGYEAAVDRWLAYLAVQEVTRIGYGAVLLQQRSGAATVIRADEVRAGSGSASAHIERVFAAHDVLVELDDAALVDAMCRVPPEHRVERTMRFVDGAWHGGDALITLNEGVGIEATIDPVLTEILLLATSGSTVRAAAAQVASRAGIDPGQQDELVAAACAMVRQLIGFGIVELAPAA